MEIGKVTEKQAFKNTSSDIKLPFDPFEFPRESHRHYISATESELIEMLSVLGLEDMSQLFGHIDQNLLFPRPLSLPDESIYNEVAEKVSQISNLSNHKTSFIGDQLPVWETPPIVEFVSNFISICI